MKFLSLFLLLLLSYKGFSKQQWSLWLSPFFKKGYEKSSYKIVFDLEGKDKKKQKEFWLHKKVFLKDKLDTSSLHWLLSLAQREGGDKVEIRFFSSSFQGFFLLRKNKDLIYTSYIRGRLKKNSPLLQGEFQFFF